MNRLQYLLIALLLGAVLAMPPYSIDTSLPALPAMADAFGVGSGAVQITLSAVMLGSAMGQLIVGPLSDRFGRRPILLLALALFTLAGVGCAFTSDIETLAALRLAMGFSVAGCRVLPRAVVRDLYDREDAARLLSYMMVISGTAPIAGPLIGGYFTVWFGWWAVFAFMAGYSVIVLALIGFFFRETQAARDYTALDPRRLLRNFGLILRNRIFWAYLSCNICITGGLFAFLAGSSLVLIRFLGETPEEYGIDFAAVMVVAMAFNYIGARLVGRLGIDRLLFIGAIMAASSGAAIIALAVAGVDSVAAILVPMAVFMAAYSFVIPQGTAAALSPFPEVAGAASSLLGFVQICVGTATATAVGFLDDGTQMPITIAIGAMGIGLLIVYMCLVRPLARR
ncbi:MAG: multidrug effflux MFS transporter [Alphaproteobacteria bacterium]